jgi:hypothetical protein
MTAKTRMYHVHLHELCVYDLKVGATSAEDAGEKGKAFFVQQRMPQTEYQQEGLTATLLGSTVVARHFRPRSEAYHVYLHQWCIYDVNVVATSAEDAEEKVKAFYAQQLKPQATYRQEGLTATLQANMALVHRRPSRPSTWAQA